MQRGASVGLGERRRFRANPSALLWAKTEPRSQCHIVEAGNKPELPRVGGRAGDVQTGAHGYGQGGHAGTWRGTENQDHVPHGTDQPWEEAEPGQAAPQLLK